MSNILGTVIFYNPSREVISNLKTYANQVDEIVIIDNSDKPHDLLPALKDSFPELHYIKNDTNVGIATALNQAAYYGIEKKYQWLLTMDQDSKFAEDGSLLRLMKMTRELRSDIGIYSPVHVIKHTIQEKGKAEWEVVKGTMTSGNILSLEAFVACGPFEEKLFIDYVDHEYNCRLRKNGYQIVRVNQSQLIHGLGDVKSHRFLFMRMNTTNHSATRRYYIARNRLYVIFKYFTFEPKLFFKEMKQYWKDSLRIILFDENKGAKLLAMGAGIRDWFLGRYGKKE